jgi:predicted DNA-binding WGR domain protein
MPRYEFSEGSSNKFWQIDLDGTSFTTTYGRIGTDGQTTMKEYDSEAKAKKEYDKLIAEKVKKGYELVDGEGGGDEDEDEEEEKPAKKTAAKKASAKPAKKEVFEDEGDDEDEEEKPKKKGASGSSKGGDSGARYFEFSEGSSHKFWEIKLDGTFFTTRYGRIGTPGSETMKEYDSEEKAKKEYDKLVAEKVKKGYEEK